ncbi:PREDICTED: uncharacterized protein LOC104821812 [Tarenaya hassleriana]|uniref:uncharacterized protein LOC104821812 n=1 Tax=Tarenaya hassleriana TaxID=28532 RepID=UPI00053C4043|nr:PREDICTED: uncharacterized protein LOC104821812 [Tarenaya hassleriana]
MNREQRRRECDGCGTTEAAMIHNVRERGILRRECTDCLLKSHNGLFCPVCLQVFEGIVPPPSSRLICLSCPSITHLSCSDPSSSSSFTCPPCSDPLFSFFPVSPSSPLDKQSAKALVAAAKISALSMSKAEALAKNEADKRVREAAFARKRAQEALLHLNSLGSTPPPPDPTTTNSGP